MNYNFTRLLLVSSLVAANTIAIMPASIASNVIQTKQAKANNSKIVEGNNLKFQFNSCVRRGTTVSCSVLITSLDEDKDLEMSSAIDTWYKIYPTRIIDDQGNEYVPEKVDLGSNTAFQKVIPTSAGIKLIQGIPTKATFHYSVPQNINKLAIVEVNYYLEPGLKARPTYKAEFRDVDITTSAASTPSTTQRRRKK